MCIPPLRQGRPEACPRGCGSRIARRSEPAEGVLYAVSKRPARPAMWRRRPSARARYTRWSRSRPRGIGVRHGTVAAAARVARAAR
jgi:hypothetical protein